MQKQEEHGALPFHYRDIGNGPTVMLVHGWMVSGRVWDRILPALDDFRVIVPDLRGSGGGPQLGGPVTLEDYFADLVALCEFLDLRETHLVGHSMGGQLAVLLAAEFPERFASLSLMNPVPVQGLAFPDELQPLFRNCGGNREAVAKIIDMSCLQVDDIGRSMLVEDGISTAPTVVSTGFEAFRRGVSHVALENIRTPTTVIATDDPFLPAAYLQESIVAQLPNARLAQLKGPGHYPQIEAAKETSDLLRGLFN